ncbi:MAG: exonuclease SbcCD subunit D [Candidatus Hodarchaeota archaeon]
MNFSEINFLHIADTHFGANYSRKIRNIRRKKYGELFFEKNEIVIKEAFEKHNVDFIIHSGDFFNRSKPPPEVVDRAVKPFSQIANKNVHVYIIPGNHERSKLPFGLLHYQDNIHVFKKPTSFIFNKNGIKIQLTGFPYIRHNARDYINFFVKKACEASLKSNYHYSILVLHQLIEGSRVQNYIFRKGHNIIPITSIPKTFSYIAGGHIHRFQFIYQTNDSNKPSNIISTNSCTSVKQNCWKRSYQLLTEKNRLVLVKDPIIAYPGSLERVSFMEREEPKGYIIGKLLYSDELDEIFRAEYQFHQLNAINMIYEVWDLQIKSCEEYVDSLLEKLRRISLNKSSEILKLNGVVRVRIKGLNESSSVELNRLKTESKKLAFYLTLSRLV